MVAPIKFDDVFACDMCGLPSLWRSWGMFGRSRTQRTCNDTKSSNNRYDAGWHLSTCRWSLAQGPFHASLPVLLLGLCSLFEGPRLVYGRTCGVFIAPQVHGCPLIQFLARSCLLHRRCSDLSRPPPLSSPARPRQQRMAR
ncbi:hypothetical protein BV20DRAFT_731407 [Pilatotrama ljubarskyi]|nr:hypothetical protein BV20DRAFT_731407 [Pilatotrama ljubarskyi]